MVLGTVALQATQHWSGCASTSYRAGDIATSAQCTLKPKVPNYARKLWGLNLKIKNNNKTNIFFLV